MRTDVIVEHQHWQTVPLTVFVAQYLGKRGLPPPPPSNAVKGQVLAYINHGRWVVDCPAGCGGAMVVSEATPLFLCPECGSPENGHNWYAVRFPAQKQQIEAILLKRGLEGKEPRSRNWQPGESIAMLRTENAARGIED